MVALSSATRSSLKGRVWKGNQLIHKLHANLSWKYLLVHFCRRDPWCALQSTPSTFCQWVFWWMKCVLDESSVPFDESSVLFDEWCVLLVNEVCVFNERSVFFDEWSVLFDEWCMLLTNGVCVCFLSYMYSILLYWMLLCLSSGTDLLKADFWLNFHRCEKDIIIISIPPPPPLGCTELSGKVSPFVAATIPWSQSRHYGKLNVPTPAIYFKSSLVYSGSVLWNSLPDSRRLPFSTERFKSRYMSYIMR